MPSGFPCRGKLAEGLEYKFLLHGPKPLSRVGLQHTSSTFVSFGPPQTSQVPERNLQAYCRQHRILGPEQILTSWLDDERGMSGPYFARASRSDSLPLA